MNDAAALAVGSDLVHYFRAVDRTESLPAEKILPDVGDGAAAGSRLRGGALNKAPAKAKRKKEKQTALRRNVKTFPIRL